MSFLKTAWSFATGTVSSIVANWQAFLGVAVVSIGLGAFGTYKIMHNANQAELTQKAVATANYVGVQGRINVQLGTLYIPKLDLARSETQRRQTEIPQHVTPEIDRSYPVPLGFVRVFNDASHGPIPGPAAGSDADPSGVPLSDVAHAHTADEGTLDVCRTELNEWWAWYDQHSVAWNKAIGK
jgi:hypothetical protein